jgi:predicted PurR-regulated permease PerM
MPESDDAVRDGAVPDDAVPDDAVPDGAAPDSEDVAVAADAAGRDLRSTAKRAQSLFQPVGDDVDDEHMYGVPGAPVSRNSAFYRGFIGALGVLTAIVLAMVVREVQSVLVLILVSVFLAVGLNPFVERLIARGVRRPWAVLIVALLVLGVVALVIAVLIGAVGHQVSVFVDDAPHLIRDLRSHESIRHLDERYHFLSALQNKLEQPDLLEKTFGGAFDVGLSVLGALVNTVLIIVMTVYFLAALPQLKRAGYSLVPASRRNRVTYLGDEILRRVGGYVIGAALVALLAGTVTLILLLSVGLGQYALPLALLVALLDLVPLVGSVTGAAVVTIIGLATSLHIGVACLIFYLIYEPLEGYVIYPRVMRSSVDVPEIMTIVAVLLGGALGGIVGALLALPTAAAIKLLVQDVWIRRQDST